MVITIRDVLVYNSWNTIVVDFVNSPCNHTVEMDVHSLPRIEEPNFYSNTFFKPKYNNNGIFLVIRIVKIYSMYKCLLNTVCINI